MRDVAEGCIICPSVWVITVDIVVVVVVRNVMNDDVVDVLTTDVVVWPNIVVAVLEVKIQVEKPVVCSVLVLNEVETPVVVMVVEVVVGLVMKLVLNVVDVAVVIAATERRFDAKSP